MNQRASLLIDNTVKETEKDVTALKQRVKSLEQHKRFLANENDDLIKKLDVWEKNFFLDLFDESTPDGDNVVSESEAQQIVNDLDSYKL